MNETVNEPWNRLRFLIYLCTKNVNITLFYPYNKCTFVSFIIYLSIKLFFMSTLQSLYLLCIDSTFLYFQLLYAIDNNFQLYQH